jgi:hypothetical protein
MPSRTHRHLLATQTCHTLVYIAAMENRNDGWKQFVAWNFLFFIIC